MINITERPKGIFLVRKSPLHFMLHLTKLFCFCKLQLFRCFQTFGILTMRSIFQGMFSLKQTVLQYFTNMESARINSNECHALMQKQLLVYMKISKLGSEVKIRISSVSVLFKFSSLFLNFQIACFWIYFIELPSLIKTGHSSLLLFHLVKVHDVESYIHAGSIPRLRSSTHLRQLKLGAI